MTKTSPAVDAEMRQLLSAISFNLIGERKALSRPEMRAAWDRCVEAGLIWQPPYFELTDAGELVVAEFDRLGEWTVDDLKGLGHAAE